VDYQIAVVFLTRIFFMLVFARYMRVLFDKRLTRFPVMALSYLTLPIGMTAVTAFLFLFDALPVVPAVLLFYGLPLALFFIITLNYEATWKKRLMAAAFIFAIAINYLLVIVFGIYIPSMGVMFRQSTAHFVLEMVAALFLFLVVALLLQNFRNVRKNAAILPAMWVSTLAIPLSSTVVVFIIGHAPNLSVYAQGFAICMMFGINLIVFYLYDQLSAAHARSLETALHAQEKDYYLAQICTMQESVDQVKGIRHNMKNHLAAIKRLRPGKQRRINRRIHQRPA